MWVMEGIVVHFLFYFYVISLFFPDELFTKYYFLEQLLNRDFIFRPGSTKQVCFLIQKNLKTISKECTCTVHCIPRSNIKMYCHAVSQWEKIRYQWSYVPLLGQYVYTLCYHFIDKWQKAVFSGKKYFSVCKSRDLLPVLEIFYTYFTQGYFSSISLCPVCSSQ